MSVALGSIDGARVRMERRDRFPRERLRLLRDGLIEALSEHLTQEQLGFVFNRHPEHIGRVIRGAPDGLAEQVHAILSGRI